MRASLLLQAARTGAAERWIRETRRAFPVLVPEDEFTAFLSPQMNDLVGGMLPPVRASKVPNWAASNMVTRVAWEQGLLPALLRKEHADWTFSPFNTLPLAARSSRLAVAILNIAPFAPELVGNVSPAQHARLRTLNAVTRASIRRADIVFLFCHSVFQWLGDIVPQDKIVILPNPPPSPQDIATAKKVTLPAVATGRFFVCVADLYPHKGIEDAISAIRLLDDDLGVKLLICGRPMDDAYARRLERIAGSDAGSKVMFLGSVPYPVALRLMSESVATVVTSRVENPNRVPVEAMAMGSAVIASDTPVSREFGGDAATYYPPGDSPALSALMGGFCDEAYRVDRARAASRQVEGADWLAMHRTILSSMGFSVAA